MTNVKVYLFILFTAVMLTACATTRWVPADKTERTPKAPEYKMEIYDSAGLHRPYKIIGAVIASTGPFHHVTDAIEHLQDEAAKMGGDALIDLSEGLPKGSDMPKGGWFIFGNSGEIWSARVIVWE